LTWLNPADLINPLRPIFTAKRPAFAALLSAMRVACPLHVQLLPALPPNDRYRLPGRRWEDKTCPPVRFSHRPPIPDNDGEDSRIFPDRVIKPNPTACAALSRSPNRLTMGMPHWAAISRGRANLMSCWAPIDPPNTVKSLAWVIIRRPFTRAVPTTAPSHGASDIRPAFRGSHSSIFPYCKTSGFSLLV